jgi:nicotinate-nucleotide pyrophosphorylase (carboxylating)
MTPIVTATGRPTAGDLRPPELDAELERWLAEDVGDGDRTTEAIVPAEARTSATLLLREPGVIAGIGLAHQVFRMLDPDVRWQPIAADGDRVPAGPVARLEARARAVLTGERLALNLLGRLTGIATLTRRYVDAVAGTGTVILDTRKTTPGLRAAEKWAVRCGGGTNHRMGLHDAVLIKDNHLLHAGDLPTAVQLARAAGLPVEVECDTLDQVAQALDAGADRILLDNMSLADLRASVALVDHRVPLEASGGVTLDTVAAIAATGVDLISVGALTHAARSIDVALEIAA